jgi:hypothetical protein
MLIAVVGTLVTDNLTDNFGVPLEITTIIFTITRIGRTESRLPGFSVHIRRTDRDYNRCSLPS